MSRDAISAQLRSRELSVFKRVESKEVLSGCILSGQFLSHNRKDSGHEAESGTLTVNNWRKDSTKRTGCCGISLWESVKYNLVPRVLRLFGHGDSGELIHFAPFKHTF